MSLISRRNDEPGQIAQREFTDILYGRNTPYGWDTQYSTIANIKRADLQAFYQRYFFPSNIILGVQGDFVTADMKAHLTQIFADWTVRQAPVPRFPPVHFDYAPGTYLASKPEVNQTNFIMGQGGGERNSPDYPALEVMSDILGSGFNSRLFRRIRTQLGYVYDVDANWAAHYDHPGVFVINGSTKSSSTVDAIKAAREEVDRIRKEPVTEEELESAKDTVLNSFVFSFDTPEKTINRLLTYYYFGYPKDFIFKYQTAIKALTRDDILRVAKKYIDPSKFVLLAVGNPKEFGTSLDTLGSKTMPVDLTIPMPPGMSPGEPSGPGGSEQ
jgi:zinc protease